MFNLKIKAYAYIGNDLNKRIPLTISDEAHYYDYLRQISSEYPFLSIIGLRIITELKLKTYLKNRGVHISDKLTLGGIIKKLPTDFPAGWKKNLIDFAEFQNIASHGYEIEKQTALWALEAIPVFLKSIK